MDRLLFSITNDINESIGNISEVTLPLCDEVRITLASPRVIGMN